jgi:hypothetical protein
VVQVAGGGEGGAEGGVLIMPALCGEKFELQYYVQVAGGRESGAEQGVLIMPALCGEKFELLCGAGCGWRGKWCRGWSVYHACPLW